MHFKFIQALSQKAQTALLFFAGFAASTSHFSHISASDEFDVFIVYDYEDLSLPGELIKRLAGYKSIKIAGFSMGVAVAARLSFSEFLSEFSLDLAICGTEPGIDKELGIHERIFKRSMDGFSANSFTQNIGAPWLDMSQRDNYKNELKSLLDFCNCCMPKTKFKRAIAADSDKIFTLNAMKKCFNERLKIINGNHFIFNQISSWDELCKM